MVIASCEVWVSLLDELDGLVEFLLVFALLGWVSDEHARSGSLGLACLSNLSSAADVDVRHVLLFAEDSEVREHIDGRDVSCDDADTIEE